MSRIKRITSILIFFILLHILLSTIISAEDYHPLEDLDVQLIDTPVMRSDLYYADVRDDGWFTLMTWNTNVRDTNSVQEKFFDIYNAEGQFQQTVRLISQKPAYFTLTNQALNIYIFPNVVIYDLSSGEIHISQSDLNEEEIRKLNQQKRFSAGEWTYMFKGITRPYAAFYRKNGSQTQLLVKTEGESPTGTQALIQSSVTAFAAIIGLLFIVRSIKRNKKMNGGFNS